MRLLLLLTCLLVSSLTAQDKSWKPAVTEEVARQHLIRSSPPIYPAIAKLAKITGEEKLLLRINEQGKVEDVHVISGQPMLVQSAIDAAKGYEFSKFDIQYPVIAPMTISFGAPLSASEQKAEDYHQTWFPKFRQCDDSLKSGDLESASKSCSEALTIALNSSPEYHLERIDSYQMVGNVAYRRGDFVAAAANYEEAIKIAKKNLHGTDAELAYPYASLARAQEKMHQSAAALANYETAITVLKSAIEKIGSEEMRRKYGETLALLERDRARVVSKQP